MAPNTQQPTRSALARKRLNSAPSIPASKLIESNPDAAVLASKLIAKSRRDNISLDNNTGHQNLGYVSMMRLSESMIHEKDDADNVMKLFPDLELAAQILISSILSPKDMAEIKLTFSAADTVASSTVTQALCSEIEGYCKSKGLEEQLPGILRDMLFRTGSHVRAVIPENVMDDLINGVKDVRTEGYFETGLFPKEQGLEKNLTKELGILNGGVASDALNSKFSQAFESFKTSAKIPSVTTGSKVKFDLLEVTDNFFVLKLPKVIEQTRKKKLAAVLESHGVRTNGSKNVFSLFKASNTGTKSFVRIGAKDTASRRSAGSPLELILPSEAVIPVGTPGNRSNHVGYFVLVDSEGYPVTAESSYLTSGILEDSIKSDSTGILNSLTEKARKNLVGTDIDALLMSNLTKLYGEVVNSMLSDKFAGGIMKSKLSVHATNDVLRVMLARTFANQLTRLVFVPEELVSYFAFQHKEDGTGKSLLFDLKVLTSLRAAVLFADVSGHIKSAISITSVKIKLDPLDPDPLKTVELAQHNVVKLRQQYLPLGLNRPEDLADWTQRAGLEFSFEGHPGLPDTQFEFDTKNLQHVRPDTDLVDNLRKSTIMGVGLSPETVDNGFGSEFATTVVSNNILLAKRVSQYQNIFMGLFTDYVRKLAFNDDGLYQRLVEVVTDNRKFVESNLNDEGRAEYDQSPETFINDVVSEFLAQLRVTLPKPSTASLDNLVEAFSKQSTALDDIFEKAILPDSLLSSDIAGEIGNNVSVLRDTYKSYFLRDWLGKNGLMSELSEITLEQEDGTPVVDLHKQMSEYVARIMHGSVKYIQTLRPMRNAVDADLSNMDADMTGAGGDSTSSADSNDSDGGDTEDEFGGFGDMDEDTEESGVDEPDASGDIPE